MVAKTGHDMKHTESDPTNLYDDIEDLTLFADESFDTDDVDLFEFTGEDDSPLTRLKSIILSLDWEINDDILQELSDEVGYLNKTWQDDKVAAAYLQGLDKVGRYLRSKGAYAHPNSIKLLLTFYYNFEKIISSPNITGDEITTLLKGDVRKFKILQYQISQYHDTPDQSPAESTAETKVTDTSLADDDISTQPSDAVNHLKMLKAAILSLDWEVTDESLKQFKSHLQPLEEELVGNQPALVLVQGLQALGGYISEEKASAHPDSFTLMDSFYDGLSLLHNSEEHQLNDEEIQNILVDRINRLNTLKAIIVEKSGTGVAGQVVDEVVDQLVDSEVEPVEQVQDELESPTLDLELPASPAEIHEEGSPPDTPAAETDFTGNIEATVDSFFDLDDATPAMETAYTQYPEEILPPDAIQPLDDAISDSHIEEQLSSGRGFTPALSETDEISGYREETQPLDVPAQSDLEDQLDLLFADSEDIGISSSEEKPTPVEPSPASETIAALSDVEAPINEEMPAFDDKAELDTADSIESKLDNFFAETPDEESEKDKQEETPATQDQQSLEEAEEAMYFDNSEGMTPALADSDEDVGFSESDAVAALSDSPLDAIEEKLDFFFGDEKAGTDTADQRTESTPPALEESLDALFGESEETVSEDSTIPALADTEIEKTELEVDSPNEESLQQEQQLEEGLDHFFAEADDSADGSEEDVTALTRAIEDTIVDETVTPALADTLLEAEEQGDKSLTLDEDVDELFASYETTELDENVDSLFDGADAEDENSTNLATLGAALPSLVSDPSASDIADTSKLIDSLKTNQQQTDDQKVLLELLNSVLNQLTIKAGTSDEKTEEIIGQLYDSIINKQLTTSMLPGIIQNYTGWISKHVATTTVADSGPAQSPEPVEEPSGQREESNSLRQEIRALLKEELAPLLNELKK